MKGEAQKQGTCPDRLAFVMESVKKPLVFTPGQFLFVNFRSLALREEFHPFELSMQRQVFSVRVREVSNQFHPFSITSAPGDQTLRITVKAVGDYPPARCAGSMPGPDHDWLGQRKPNHPAAVSE